MKNLMKRSVSLLLALLMVMSVCSGMSALAAAGDGVTKKRATQRVILFLVSPESPGMVLNGAHPPAVQLLFWNEPPGCHAKLQ